MDRGKAPQRRVLHGALVGFAATVIYVGISLGRPEPIAYVIAHALKVLGGAVGGLVALKRGAANAVSEARPSCDPQQAAAASPWASWKTITAYNGLWRDRSRGVGSTEDSGSHTFVGRN